MHPILIASTFLIFLCSCVDPTPPVSTTSSSDSTVANVPYKNWINLNYIDCMDTSCPCQCLHGPSDVTMMRIDSLKDNLVAFVFGATSDYDLWTLIPGNNGILEGRSSGDEVVGTIYHAHDTLVLLKDGDTARFVNFPQFEKYDHLEFTGYLNTFLLLNSINKNDTLIRSLLALDSTRLTCSPELGNLIYAPKLPVHKYWILSTRGNKVALYEFISDGNKMHAIPKEDTVLVGLFPR